MSLGRLHQSLPAVSSWDWSRDCYRRRLMQSIFSKSLTLMGQGMLAIFVVIFIIFLVLLFLGKNKQKGE
jgi:hypothetical protein